MCQISTRLSLFLVTIALASPVFSEQPIFTLQSASTTRLLNVVQKLGLPDPLASAGLDTKSTLDRLSDSVALNAPMGGLIFLTQERPHLVICLPLTNVGRFMNALDAFASTPPVPAPNGVYTIGKEDKFFAKQAGTFLLLSDSPKYLPDAADTMISNPWSSVTDDVVLKADFTRMPAMGKSLLLAELMSMTTTKPTAGLYLNVDSVTEHLRYGLQQYFGQSLFECRSFDIALNTSANGEIRVQLQTQEDTSSLRTPSTFQYSQPNKASFALDFTSKLSEANMQETLKWVANWEKDLLGSIDNDSIQDKSDLDSTKRIVKFFSGLIQQSVANRKVDCFATIGSANDQAYLAGSIALADSAKLAQQLTEALEAARQIGLSFTDLGAKNVAGEALADFLIDLPKNMSILGVKNENSKLHVRIANQGLWVGIGNESEQLRERVIATPDKGLAPITIDCDLDVEGIAAGENSNLLPFNFRKMKLNVQVNDSGRLYEIVFSNLGQPNPSTPSVSTQAAAK